jgi:preprotein translocase subunit SecF
MNIITHRKILVAIGATMMLGAAAVLLFVGLRIGIDFTGGSLIEVSYDTAPEKTAVESLLEPYELGGVSVRASIDETGDDAFFIRTRDLSESERQSIESDLLAVGEGGNVSRFTSIGPVIGQELADKALWAIAGVVLIIVFYVAFAFRGIGTPVSSWVYGLVTIFVLIHDVLLPTAFMALLGLLVGAEVDVLFVMALLAVLGYSVNDTIVIFDRVRENLVKNRTEQVITRTEPGGFELEEKTYTLTAPYEEIVGTAVAQSLARSINTSLTTLAALVALYFIGGDVTQNFALVLIIGVLAGTYSSLCLASPLVVWYEERKRKVNS